MYIYIYIHISDLNLSNVIAFWKIEESRLDYKIILCLVYRWVVRFRSTKRPRNWSVRCRRWSRRSGPPPISPPLRSSHRWDSPAVITSMWVLCNCKSYVWCDVWSGAVTVLCVQEMGTSGGGAGGGGEVLVAPLSVQPTRKAAPGAALRRFWRRAPRRAWPQPPPWSGCTGIDWATLLNYSKVLNELQSCAYRDRIRVSVVNQSVLRCCHKFITVQVFIVKLRSDSVFGSYQWNSTTYESCNFMKVYN